MFLHIPAWCDHYTVEVNGQPVSVTADKGYACDRRVLKKNDELRLSLEMKAKLFESNPLLEETRNQVAVMRGPVVYCLESTDLDGLDIDKVVIPASASFQPEMIEIDGAPMAALTGEVLYLSDDEWQDTLYREVRQGERKIRVRLIPYYAFGNRGHSEMTVWMPLNR